AMKELVAGLAPGMPEGVVDRIAERTAGVPLHAVEFVRMLINSGRLVDVDEGYELVGDPGELAIPDSVSAIIGARLDRLQPDEVAVIQDASVLGLSFTLGGIADMAEVRPEELETTLMALVRADVLELDEDPRSPERGQYRFVQSLIREVAYGRLPKSDRVKRHLEVARRTELLDDPELAGVVAGHYASAASADPGNKDLMDRARGSIIASAERARALRSDLQAVSLYQHAIELASDEVEIAELKMELSVCLEKSGREDLAFEVGSEALEYFREMSDAQGIAAAATRLAHALAGNFNAGRAGEIILPVYEATPHTDDETWARLASETSRALALTQRYAEAIEVADRVLPLLEQLDMVEELLDTLNNKAMSLMQGGRSVESVALFRGIADVAADRGLLNAEIRAINNLTASMLVDSQIFSRKEELTRLINKSGNIAWQVRTLFYDSLTMFHEGDLEKAFSLVEDGERLDLSEFWEAAFECNRFWFEQTRDGVDPVKHDRVLEVSETYLRSEDLQLVVGGFEIRANAMYLQGELESVVTLAIEGQIDPFGYPDLLETAVGSVGIIGDIDNAKRLLTQLEALDSKGRALNGLRQFGTMVVSALDGDVESALVARARMLELWETTMPPLSRAHASAVTAAVLPFDHPEAFEAAGKAMDFFTTHGYQAYLTVYEEVFSRYQLESGEVAV
ncbi:MAG: hypothetical protein V3S26_04080, partial [Acidimicrobiia bacterium]